MIDGGCMNIEKEREAFEQWVSGCGLSISTKDALYRIYVMGWMWEAWQARANLCKKEQK